MFSRTFCERSVIRIPKFFRLNIKKCSQSGSNDDNDSKSVDSSHAHDDLSNDFKHSSSGSEEIKKLLQDAATFIDAKDDNWATTPYPQGAPTTENLNEQTPKIESSDTNIILFPGQGTLQVGSVSKYLHYPKARDLFDIANEVLGYDLLKICKNGPQEKLDLTQFNQPATVVTSLAALEKLRDDLPNVFDNCVATAGYSVGEITSLIFSGVMTFEDGLRLIAARGSAMQQAATVVPQGMLSVFCCPDANVYKSCREAVSWAQDLGVTDPVCSIAIYIYTQGKVLAGNDETLEYITKNSMRLGLRKPTRLPVSGAFHTSLMQPAQNAVRKVLNTIQLDQPIITTYSNYSGQPHNINTIKKHIIKQIVSPVKWEQIIQRLYNRSAGKPFPKTFDVGSGGRLKTILKLINAKAANFCRVI